MNNPLPPAGSFAGLLVVLTITNVLCFLACMVACYHGHLGWASYFAIIAALAWVTCLITFAVKQYDNNRG